MSTWRNVGITYLKYADICATHVRNALKEPAKTKAKNMSNMHARIVQWEEGKRGAPGARLPGARPPAGMTLRGWERRVTVRLRAACQLEHARRPA